MLGAPSQPWVASASIRCCHGRRDRYRRMPTDIIGTSGHRGLVSSPLCEAAMLGTTSSRPQKAHKPWSTQSGLWKGTKCHQREPSGINWYRCPPAKCSATWGNPSGRVVCDAPSYMGCRALVQAWIALWLSICHSHGRHFGCHRAPTCKIGTSVLAWCSAIMGPKCSER